MDTPSPRQRVAAVSVAVRAEPPAIWVRVVGDVDLSNVAQLQSALAEVDLEGRAELHLDLGDLSFCDLRGCRHLATFERRARLMGHVTHVHGANQTVTKVLGFLSPELAGRLEGPATRAPDPGPEVGLLPDPCGPHF